MGDRDGSDREAFDDFFRTQHDALLRLSYALTLDREAARDVAQETMARAWRDWDRIADGHPVAWSRQVALNIVRSRGRRLRTERAAVLDRVPDAELVVTDPDLVAALRALTDRQREAVVLHHLLDLSVAECAAAMDVAVPSVKVHLRRGRAHLGRALGASHGTPATTGPASTDAATTDRNDTTEVPS
jgi:RNA polymerase sigma-70 factor (ECF subfamily)